MNAQSVIDELKKTVEECKLSNKISISNGDLKDLAGIIGADFPNGKILSIFDEESFFRFGHDFTGLLKNSDLKPVNVVLDGLTEISVDNAADLVNVPEDTRAIVFFDYSLKDLCYYVAGALKLPIFYLMRDFEIDGVLSDTVYIESDKILESYKISLERYIVIDFEEIEKKEGLSSLFASETGKVLSLAECKLKEIFSENVNPLSFSLAMEAITDAYKIFEYVREEQVYALVQDGLKLEIADNFSNGKLFRASSVENGRLIYNRLCEKCESMPLEMLSVLAKLVYLYLQNGCEDITEICNYLERGNSISEKTGISEWRILNNFDCQIKKLHKEEIPRKKIIETFNEIMNVLSYVDKIKSIYTALGGKNDANKEDLLFAVKHAGDLTGEINVVSFLRESGITEYI